MGGQLSISYINKRLKVIFQKYNVRTQNPISHILRKTFGKRVYEMDGHSERSIIYLSDIFNHSSTAITRRYIGIAQEQIKDVYLNLQHNVCIYEHLYIFLFVYTNIMANKKTILLPKARKILVEVGENIKLARLRRKLSSEQVAERANIGRTTLYNIEKGDPGVSIGAYLQVLMVLRLGEDFLHLAKDDELGRKLQDAKLGVKERAPKRKNK